MSNPLDSWNIDAPGKTRTQRWQKPSAWRIHTQWPHGLGKSNQTGSADIFLMRFAVSVAIVLKGFMASLLGFKIWALDSSYQQGQNKLKKCKNWSLLTSISFYTVSLSAFRSKFSIMAKQTIGNKEHSHLRFEVWCLFRTGLLGCIHLPQFLSCPHTFKSPASACWCWESLWVEVDREGRGPRGLLQDSTSHEMKVPSRTMLTQWQSQPRWGSPVLAHTMIAVIDPYFIWS